MFIISNWTSHQSHRNRSLKDLFMSSALLVKPLWLQAKGASLVSVACQSECKLAKMCDMSVYLPLHRELCPFDLAPVTSTALQMIFGDTVAIALMQVEQPSSMLGSFTSTPRKRSSQAIIDRLRTAKDEIKMFPSLHS